MNKRGGAFLPTGTLPYCWVREVPATLSSAAHGSSDPPLDAKPRRRRIGHECPILTTRNGSKRFLHSLRRLYVRTGEKERESISYLRLLVVNVEVHRIPAPDGQTTSFRLLLTLPHRGRSMAPDVEHQAVVSNMDPIYVGIQSWQVGEPQMDKQTSREIQVNVQYALAIGS